ncbi:MULTISPECIES: D-allose transporter substrate-binding protein [Anaerotruncus]|uniref:D-allose transporter substrate-binding protein n=2 Tax=Anaerotruncus TaxID=244127 RepID=A0A498CKH9_9FIRM|nr:MULTISPECIES: D-allose transporter substrate-binding protein [Anaerotruncus]MBC3939582.1 D-allose transporter substrate-binding protein [Anaerotruncus massiliensis (ex Togo et al. 2019)]RLL08734.1 D-allose transporter substrate-binding protein [Anaerotruncus massiliensis (ex Liu et al. 2021)]
MKKIIAILLAMAIGLSLAACGSTPAQPSQPAAEASSTDAAPAESAPAAEGKAEYAVVLKVLSSQFWQTMRDGIQAEADKMGIKVDIYAANTEDDVEGQVTLLENAISTGYKAIGVAPISDVNLNNAIADATSKGIKIVNIDEKVNMDALAELGGACTAYVATDNVAVGKLGAEYLIEQIGGAGEVAIVEGKAGAVSGENRRDGAKAAFEAAGLTIVESQPADWDRTKAYDVATNYITAHPDLKAIYCCNDTMAMGVQEAVEASGKDIKVCGTDGNDDAIQSVADGKLAATVAQDPAAVGAKGLQLMVEAVENDAAMEPGAEVPVYGIDAILITSENASEYIK